MPIVTYLNIFGKYFPYEYTSPWYYEYDVNQHVGKLVYGNVHIAIRCKNKIIICGNSERRGYED